LINDLAYGVIIEYKRSATFDEDPTTDLPTFSGSSRSMFAAHNERIVSGTLAAFVEEY
jgi:hypothetical protein